MKAQLYLFLFLCTSVLSAQEAIDFTITDTHGQQHRLYEDYLDQGKTVVIDFFFVACPPCNAFAPSYEQLYQARGGGEDNVEFFSLSNKDFDSNQDVAQYDATHGLTMPSAGDDGNAFNTYLAYRDGGYGPFYGTPHFVVIAPDRTVFWGVNGSGNQGKVNAINNAIDQAIQLGGNEPTTIDTTKVTLDIRDTKGQPIDVNIQICDASTEVCYPISLDANGQFTYTSFSEAFPNINNPVLTFSKAGDWRDGVKTTDILFIQRHILDLQHFEHDYQFIAGDVSNDGRISNNDAAIIRKLILEINDDFPNNSSWKIIPNQMALDTTNLNIEADIQVIKIGDVTRH